MQLQQEKQEIEREKLKTALVQNQLTDLREGVAQILPTHGLSSKDIADARLFELAQAVRVPAADASIDLSSVLMNQGREEFKNQHYEKAAHIFRDVISKYPVSPQIIDAHFLLGESLFQTEKYDDCLDVIYEMVSQFPQSEMTGYLMLRNAQIFQMRKRKKEAVEIYTIVQQQFASHAALKEQARRLALEN
jgi:TolA-binding protein